MFVMWMWDLHSHSVLWLLGSKFFIFSCFGFFGCARLLVGFMFCGVRVSGCMNFVLKRFSLVFIMFRDQSVVVFVSNSSSARYAN